SELSIRQLPTGDAPCAIPKTTLASQKLAQRPARALGHNRIFISRQLFELRDKAALAAVSHRNDCISSQAGTFRAANRRAPKFFTELLSRHLGQPIQHRIDESFARLKLRCPGRRRLAIPWTHVLANVTPKNMPPHALPHFVRDGA